MKTEHENIGEIKLASILNNSKVNVSLVCKIGVEIKKNHIWL